MTKQELDEIIEIKKELAYIEAKIASLEKRIAKIKEKCPACDVVTGSDDEAPFVLHHMLIEGIEQTDTRTMLNLEYTLSQQKKTREQLVEKYSKTIQKVDAYIPKIPISKHRQVFERYYCDGMTYEEIAEELEISDKTVSRWMAKILKNLKMSSNVL